YLTEFAKIEIPGGVVVPNALSRQAKSDDTITLLRTILADIIALKVKIGDTKPVTVPPYEAGRTPTDVYDQLVFSYDAIYALEDAASGS
ncbi:MAG: hypothetical protein R3261_14085, partial [Alphaproteobacteria bacterium]|nr:hypothetical protein [Alphaproteobacteria bacterium]